MKTEKNIVYLADFPCTINHLNHWQYPNLKLICSYKYVYRKAISYAKILYIKTKKKHCYFFLYHEPLLKLGASEFYMDWYLKVSVSVRIRQWRKHGIKKTTILIV